MTATVSPDPDLLQQVLVDCERHISSGNLAAALGALNEAVSLDPENAELLGHRGRLALVQGDTDSARQDFSAALKLNPQCAPAFSGLARLQLESGNVMEAEFNAYRALGLDAGDEDAAAVLRALNPQKKSAAAAPPPPTTTAVVPEKKPLRPLVPAATVSGSSDDARQSVRQFYARAEELFADVAPPELSELHLRHSRVVPSREHILSLLPKGGVCAEVGTQTGKFAKKIFSILAPAKLHIFDIDFTPFDHAWFEPALRQGVVELHPGDSSTLLGALPDRHFDFIYIDGDHTYDGVVRDLRAAAQKIKDDGWIVCNDYTLFSPLEGIKYGVYRAVNELCLHHGFEILYLGLEVWGYHDVAIKKRKN